MRLAVVQAVLLITVFAVAGSLTKVTVKLIYRHEVQTRLLGEATALRRSIAARAWPTVAKAVSERRAAARRVSNTG